MIAAIVGGRKKRASGIARLFSSCHRAPVFGIFRESNQLDLSGRGIGIWSLSEIHIKFWFFPKDLATRGSFLEVLHCHRIVFNPAAHDIPHHIARSICFECSHSAVSGRDLVVPVHQRRSHWKKRWDYTMNLF
jgi:hypothetical protein